MKSETGCIHAAVHADQAVRHPFNVRRRYLMPSGHEARFCGVSQVDGQDVATFEYVAPGKVAGRRVSIGESVDLQRRQWGLPVHLVPADADTQVDASALLRARGLGR